MSIPEDLSAHLPTPRADEPEALREDIADEIADHLHCAARREHLQNSGNRPLTDQAALAAAIERFGEPAAIARRLWWDAMKERIMAQRVIAVMASAVAVAAIFACVVLWQATQAARAEQAAMIQSQQSLLAAMLAEMKSSSKGEGAQWQTLKIRLIDEQGKPVRGNVQCTGQANHTSDSVDASADGVAEFYLPPGQYTASIVVGSSSTTVSQLLPPGRPTTRTIVCPTLAAKTALLQFDVDKSTAPADLNIYSIAQIQWTSRRVGDQTWVSTPYASTSGTRLLISPEGKVLGQLPKVSPRPSTNSTALANPNSVVFPKRLAANVKLSAPEQLEPGTYYINLAPYVPEALTVGANDLPGPADARPALRSVWWAGASTQLYVNTQAEDFTGVAIDDGVFNWKTLRGQITAGTPEEPQIQYPENSYSAVPYQAPAAPPIPYVASPESPNAPGHSMAPSTDSGQLPHAGSGAAPPTAPAAPPIKPVVPPSVAPPMVPPNASENEAPPAKIYLLPQKTPE
jgi:hypothetical protein